MVVLMVLVLVMVMATVVVVLVLVMVMVVLLLMVVMLMVVVLLFPCRLYCWWWLRHYTYRQGSLDTKPHPRLYGAASRCRLIGRDVFLPVKDQRREHVTMYTV
jgi:hypothetical protein